MAGHTTGTEVPVQPEWQTHTQPDGYTEVKRDADKVKQDEKKELKPGFAVQGEQDF